MDMIDEIELEKRLKHHANVIDEWLDKYQNAVKEDLASARKFIIDQLNDTIERQRDKDEELREKNRVPRKEELIISLTQSALVGIVGHPHSTYGKADKVYSSAQAYWAVDIAEETYNELVRRGYVK